MIRVLVFIFLLTLAAGCGQGGTGYFSGTVVYEYTYTTDSLDADSLAGVRPQIGYFRYDENDYQSRFTGKDTSTYFYSGILNKCIAEEGHSGVYTCDDYGEASDSVITYRIYDTEEKVLGHSCRIMEIQKSRSLVKYYFSEDLIMSPGTYRNHKSFNWDFYGRISGGGLVLKLEHRFRSFTMYGIAVQVEKKNKAFRALEIEDSVFRNYCN